MPRVARKNDLRCKGDFIVACVAYNRKDVLRFLAACILTSLAWGQTALEQGERAFEAGNYAEAARLFEAAHKQSPRCDVLFFLGMAQYRMKQVDAALISFQAAVQCDPKLAFAYLGLAEAYAERGNDDEALAAYAQVLKLEPKNPDALRGAGELYLRGKVYGKAVDALETLTKLEPANPQAHADLGAAYYGAGNQDEAEAQYQAALRIKPNHASAMLGLANIYLRKGKEDQAIAVLQKLVKLVPNAYEPHYLLGTAYNRQSHYQDAVTELQTALRLGGNESEIYYHLARAYGGLGRADDRRSALANFAELTKKSKADAAAQREAAQLVEQAKNLVDSGDVNHEPRCASRQRVSCALPTLRFCFVWEVSTTICSVTTWRGITRRRQRVWPRRSGCIITCWVWWRKAPSAGSRRGVVSKPLSS